MVTQYRAWLDGKPLDALPGVCIVGIDESYPQMSTKTEPRGWGAGTTFLTEARRSLTVAIRFELPNGTQVERNAALDMIRAWCAPGWLTISTRPGKRLRVRPSDLPTMVNHRYDTTFTVRLTAYEQPYWESESPALATINGSGSETIYTPGTEKTAVCTLRAENTGSTICNSLTVTVDATVQRFELLGLAPGETLALDYDDHSLLQIMIRTADGVERSAYASRTPESDDDLLAPCGKACTVRVEADGNLKTTIMARGRWT